MMKQEPCQTQQNTQETRIVFFPVSEGKLITLYILSFGFYGIYWFYRNWKLQQAAMDKKIYPVWRAIFSVFFAHSLFKRIDQQASHLEQRHKFNANILATFFVVAIISSHILDHIYGNILSLDHMSNNIIILASLLLFILSVFPLVKVQSTVNRINNDMLGYMNYKYSLWNYVWIVLGTVMWILLGLGLLFDFMGIAVTE